MAGAGELEVKDNRPKASLYRIVMISGDFIQNLNFPLEDHPSLFPPLWEPLKAVCYFVNKTGKEYNAPKCMDRYY